MALALYRKYRPATFAEVVGQDHVTQPLRTALAAGRINHAYLFSGPRGCGKTSSARIMARSLNCVEGPTPDPCGVCPSCVALAPEGPGSIDVVELDAASHGGVDDTRDLRDRAFYMPAESRYRVFIIDEAHMVSPQGFNALLKIVEEPPEHLVFIFATTEPEKVMATIRSRTHHYPFRLIPPATLRKLLERLCTEEGVRVEPTVFPLVIQAGGGSARDSLSILDQLLAGAGPDGVTYRNAVDLLGVTDAALLDEAVDALAADDGASVFGAVDKVVEAGHDPRRFATDLLERFRDLVILAAVPDAAEKGLLDVPQDQLTAMVGQAERLGAGTLTRMADILHTGLTEMRGTTAPRLALELMCARMPLPVGSDDAGALVQRVERLEKSVAGLGTGSAAQLEAAPRTAAPEKPQMRVPATSGSGSRTGRRPEQAPEPDSAPAPGEAAAVANGADGGSGGVTAAAPAVRARKAPARTASTETSTGASGLGLPAAPPGLPSAPSTPGAGSSSAATRPSAKTSAADQAGDDWMPPPEPPDEADLEEPPAGSVDRPRSTPPIRSRAAGVDLPPPPSVSPTTRPPSAPAAPAISAGPADSAAPAASDVGGTAGEQRAYDVTDVRRVWPEILAAVKQQRRTTQILLESATVAELAKNTLVLSMSSPGLARKVEEHGNAQVLRQALTGVLGVDWAIRCTASGGTRSEPAQTPTEEFVPEDEEPAPGQPFVLHDPEIVAAELLSPPRRRALGRSARLIRRVAQRPRATHSSRSAASSAIVVVSPCPVRTTVSDGSVSSRSRIDSMMVGKSLYERPVTLGPPLNSVSPENTVPSSGT